MAKRREELIKEGRSNDDSISFRFSFHFFLTYRETDSHRLIRNANPFESKRLALIPRSKRFERQSSYRACVYQEKRTGRLLIPTISLMNFVRSDESIIPAIISLSLCVDDGGICVCVCVCGVRWYVKTRRRMRSHEPYMAGCSDRGLDKKESRKQS